MHEANKLTRLIALWVLIFVVSFGTVTALAAAAKPKARGSKVTARIQYSGNLEGELEPCG
jgi:hypothetical protein